MKILIVDDNDDNRMTIELLLEDFDSISITDAVDGLDAVKKCREEKFDLIFMDIMMPNMDGIEATKEIKKFAKESMIIALSALDDDTSKQAMIQNGAEDYITKPIESELFIQRVKNYMHILSMRDSTAKHTETFMLFKEEIYPTTLTFKIDSENDLAYFWGYYLNNEGNKAEQISDVVRIIYGLGLWMLRNGKTFNIVAEENSKDLFLTLLEIQSINERIVKNLLIKHCPNNVYIVKEDTVSFRLSKVSENKELVEAYESEAQNIDENEKYKKEILAKTHFNKTSADVYVEQSAINFMEKIDTLDTIEDAIDAALNIFEKEPSKENMSKVSEGFFEYVSVLELLVEFEHLAYALDSLGQFIMSVDESMFEKSKVEKFVTMSIYMLNDLRDWRENIFIKQDANDIHYLDSSLLSSCLQIESIFSEQASEEDENELEFF